VAIEQEKGAVVVVSNKRSEKTLEYPVIEGQPMMQLKE
jgi:hypothetical protein